MAQVKAAAEAWVNAQNRAYQNADDRELSAMAVPDSQAYGAAGEPRYYVMTTHKAFITDSTRFDSERVSLSVASAVVNLTFTVHGTEASFPGLRPLGTPSAATLTLNLQLELVDGRWLVDTVH